MRRIVPCLLAAALVGTLASPALVAADTASATHYRWKDAAGVVHFADTIPASALAGGYDIVDSQGQVVRHVERELTPAERRAAGVAASKAGAIRREAQQRRIEDTQMLAAYPTDADLARSQQAQLKQIQTDIATLETNLHSQEDSLTELLTHAADLEHSGQPIPPYINKRIAEQRGTVNDERAALARRRADFTNAQAKFAAQLAHYRDLRTKFSNSDDPPPQ